MNVQRKIRFLKNVNVCGIIKMLSSSRYMLMLQLINGVYGKHGFIADMRCIIISHV